MKENSIATVLTSTRSFCRTYGLDGDAVETHEQLAAVVDGVVFVIRFGFSVLLEGILHC